MKRKIDHFRQDKVGDWVAVLECGHRLHVRHQPPFTRREWVLTEEGRRQHFGSLLNCNECDTPLDSRSSTTSGAHADEEMLRMATAIKSECLKTLIEAYEEGLISGLCQEGAWEFALDQVKSLPVENIIERLP